MIKEFKVNFTEKEISLIYQKVKDYPWDSVKDLDGWEHGTNKKYLKELCDYWITKFDWSKHELEMNKFKNYTMKDIEENLKNLSNTKFINGEETVVNYSIYKVKKSLRNKLNEEK